MLILARKIDEVLHLGNNIQVRVVDICSSHVRLGIEAPREVAITRGECLNAANIITTTPALQQLPGQIAEQMGGGV